MSGKKVDRRHSLTGSQVSLVNRGIEITLSVF